MNRFAFLLGAWYNKVVIPQPLHQQQRERAESMSKSEKLNVIGCYLLVLVGVAFMISNLVWKIIVVAVLAILGGVVFYLLLKPDKPKKTGANPATPEDIDELLEQYGTDDKPSPKMAKLVKSKSESNLFRHGRVVYDDYTFFDITACHSQTYQGKRFYPFRPRKTPRRKNISSAKTRTTAPSISSRSIPMSARSPRKSRRTRRTTASTRGRNTIRWMIS